MFSNDIKELRNLNSLIEQYNSANKSKELERLTADVAKIAETIKEKKEMLASLQPELDAATKAVDDQERQEKLLAQNIEVLECEEQIMDLEKEIDAAKEELEQIEGYDTAQAVYNEAQQRIYEINSKMARHEGRRQEIVEQIRSLNRKLSSDEYRDVDKQYTEAIIKQETTQMAVNDLEKYATALDKALLRFHVMKLEEINKIIKELW